MARPQGLERAFVQKLSTFAAAFLSVLYVGGVTAGSGAIVLFLGPPYRTALSPMAVLLAGTALFSVGSIVSSYLVVLHREHTVLVAQSVSAVVYLLACALLVPTMAALGAALSTVLAAGAGTVWMTVVARTALREQPSSHRA